MHWRKFRQAGLGAIMLGMVAIAATPAFPRDSLGVFSEWGAFRDAAVPRCYAIAKAEPSRLQRDFDPYASVGTWPRRKVRNQLHLRLSRKTAPNSAITLKIGSRSFTLTGSGGNAWAKDRAMDAAIVAAMRTAVRMSIEGRAKNGRSFYDLYVLKGAATAMDAATLGCAG